MEYLRNVLSALIQNFDTVEKVIETSANSAGSALKENEKYLDSIQGKIDQFSNSLQAMWSNFLDADLVKDIVGIGTGLIQIIDKIGLLQSALLALGTYKGLGVIFKSLSSAGITVQSLTKHLWAYINGVQATTAAEAKLTQVQLHQKLARQGLTDENIQAIIAETGLGVSTDKLTKETLEAALTTLGYSDAQKEATIAKIFGTQATVSATLEEKILRSEWIKSLATQKLKEMQDKKLAAARAYLDLVTRAYVNGAATAAEVEAAHAAVTAASVPVDITKIGTTELLGLAFKGLAASVWAATKAVIAFLFTNPVGWIILAIGAIAGGIAIFNHFHKTTEELTEELNDLKSELQDVQSEIEGVNSELETMEDRIAELLAKDSLSFVEQEELDRLQKENNELQRRLDLLEEEEKIKKDQNAQGFVDVMESSNDNWYSESGKMNWFEKFVSGGKSQNIYAESQDEYIKRLMADYNTILDGTAANGEVHGHNADWYSKRIGEEIKPLVEAADGIDYYVGDNLTDQQKEVNEWLDYVYNTQDRLAIMRGGENAKTNTINRIFDKDENEAVSDSIDEYVKALRKGDISAKTSIENIIKNNKALVEDLEASGLSADAAVEYFTSFASELEFATLEGKITEMQLATSKMQALLSDTTSADFTGLFDAETGEVSATAVSEYFQGTSEATRTEIAKLIKDINDGEISVENALKQFEIFSIQSSLDIYIAEVQTNFKDVFVDLEDADGLISTFEELGEAIGSAAGALETLNQAQAEMAYSGHVSIETALQLMEYTDDYGSVLQVVDGKLQLVEGAEENLIQARINAIKTSAEASLSDATNAYNKAVLATQEYKSALTTDMSAEVVAKSWEKVLAAGAGLWEGIKSLVTDESWTDAYNRGYNATLSSITGYETEYNDSGLQALADAEAEAKARMEQDQDRVELANQLTPETLESINSSEAASGGADDPDEVKDDAFQREMDYWENRIAANQARYEQLQNEIDLLEAKGQKADASYYEEQIKIENERLRLLGEQKKAAKSHLATLTEGSEEWWEVANTLNDIEGELDDVTASIVDLQDAIGEIDTYKFEEFNSRLDDITSKLGTIRDLIAPDGEEDWFNDQGEWTEEGVAVLGTYIQELETYKNGLAEVNAERAKYSDAYSDRTKAYYESLGIHSEQEYYDKVQELTEQQYDYAQSISDTEQSVVDMYESNIDAIEEYTETLIDSYNDYIDSVKEALDAERDLYDFKKNVQKQSKDIAAIERRIASLSGSTNASDVAERRKLEAELYESRESLNDTYYDHARSAQDEALDAEQTAYEESMTKFVEGLRASLETATMNMDEFLMGVTSMVMYNADTVLTKYQETNLPLTEELTNPWIKAKEAVGTYSGDALALMNKWTEEGGFFAQFNETGTKNLQSPWSAGSTAAGAFKTSVSKVMEGVVSNISANVKTASGELSKLYQQIQDTEKRATEAEVVVNNPKPALPGVPSRGPSPVQLSEPEVKLRGLMKTSREMILGSKNFVDANTETINGTKYYRDSKTGYYYKISDLNSKRKYDGGRTTGWAIPKGTWFYTKHAKGTTGTPRDEWALTDEPQFGDELVLVPGKDGNLSFMRKGTGVVPADLTQKLFELAQLPMGDLMSRSLTAIVPNITKNDFKNEFNFESLVHVDTVDSDTLPKLEKMVDKKIDDFSKALNYSLKRFAR